MLQSSKPCLDQVYCPPLFSIDGQPVSLRRLEPGPCACRLNLVVHATHRRLRSTGFHFPGCRRAPSGAHRRSIASLAGRRCHPSLLENHLSSFVVLFSASALVATVLLFALQMFEDFHNA
jgi:hypothetical protein